MPLPASQAAMIGWGYLEHARVIQMAADYRTAGSRQTFFTLIPRLLYAYLMRSERPFLTGRLEAVPAALEVRAGERRL